MWVLNSPETSFTIDFNSSCRKRRPSAKSPIDVFYSSFDRSIKQAGTPPFSVDEQLRALLFIPIFGAAEMYFRSFISGVVEVCPYARQKAATQQVAMGAIMSLGLEGVAVAIAEHEGLTSKGQIANRTRNILGFDVNASSSLAQAIRDFESVCHLRHAVVHLNGELLFLNRRELGIKATGRIQLRPDVKVLQDVAGKVANVIRAYNSHIGAELGRRWLDEGYLSGRWKNDKKKFESLMPLILSRHDVVPVPAPADLYKDLLVMHPPARRKSRFVL